MSNLIECFRYEDKNGYGPYYNERKHIYNWSDDGWRYACDSLEKLNEWWSKNKEGMHLENYRIVKYLVKINNQLLLKVKATHMVDFRLDDVLNKENIE